MTDFTGLLERIIKYTRLFPGEDLMIQVFLNPAAGLLRDGKRLAGLISTIESAQTEIPPDAAYCEERTLVVEIHRTESREESLDALKRAAKELVRFSSEKEGRRSLMLTAGGDGFHKDCVSHLLSVYPESLSEIMLFRLPLGTGNDTPRITDPAEALALLAGGGEVIRESYIRVETARGDIDYALNVASFGLDAFVCLLLEKWKGKLKGDVYKIMVDLSALFYDFYHLTRTSALTLFPSSDGPEEEPVVIKKKILMNVFGRKGGTTYGGGKKILPGPENHLVTEMFHLPGRIMLKGLFMKGGHWPGRKRVSFFETEKMILRYPAPLLMELDGELVRLEKEDFPVTLSRVDGEILAIN